MKRNLPLVAVFIFAAAFLSAQDADLGRKIYKENAPSVLLLFVQSPSGEFTAQGSGFLISETKIATNAHVADGGKVFVELGPARIPTHVDKIDASNDLAILTIDAELSAKPLRFAEAKALPGELVFAITNPEGLERTISQGVVSADRVIGGKKLLQVSTPISHGSSGGPIFNRDGQVIGVAVGMMAEGQNLNFAVPIQLLKDLVSGTANREAPTLQFLIDQVSSVQLEQAGYKFSNDPDSDYQKAQNRLNALLNRAEAAAGDSPEELLRVAKLAQNSNSDVAVAAAGRAVEQRPSAEGYLALASALNSKYAWTQGEERQSLVKQADRAARSAIKLAHQPTAEMYYRLGDILEDEGEYIEAEKVLRSSIEMLHGDTTPIFYAGIVRNMILCAAGLNRAEDEKRWFGELLKAGQAGDYDWHLHAQSLDSAAQYKEAGEAYTHAASSVKEDWCWAGIDYDAASDPDSSLAANRKCIEELGGTTGKEVRVAWAHESIASILNDRGVYTEALSHAKEATVLDPSNAWSYSVEADALNNLQRFTEAINASKEALRLSDGKYPSMHFTLGTSYFKTENWELARQSFEKAAQLNTKDDAAAYNVGVSYSRLGYYNDAARWYEEALRRNPNRDDRDDLRRQIQNLRR